MRTQTISTLSGEQELLAAPVDPRGWLRRTDAGIAGRSERTDPSGGAAPEAAPAETGQRPVRRAGRVARSTELGAARVARSRRPRRAPYRTLVDRQIDLSQPTPVVLVDPRAAGDTTGYRMGRWARLALTVTVLTAAAVIITLMAVGSAPHTLVDVTVGPGDSLWSIASAAAPDSDPRAVIQEIREINGITSNVLPIGVVLRVPATE